MSAARQGMDETTPSHWTVYDLGKWLADKWAARLAESGRDYAAVARQLKKQGYPLEIALELLVGRAGQ